jgi:hypothetical protein
MTTPTPRRQIRTATVMHGFIAVTVAIVLAAVFYVAVSTFIPSAPAHAHDHARPDLTAWFKALRSKDGTWCCDGGDAEHAEAEYDTTKDGYRVFLKDPARPDDPGQWFDIPPGAFIEQPNLNGIPMVWWYPSYNGTSLVPKFRCFIPGAGG